MKKTVLFILLLLTVALVSCVANTKPASSIPIKEDFESVSAISDTASSESDTESESEDDSASSEMSEDSSEGTQSTDLQYATDETVEFGSFTVETEFATYDFLAYDGTGDYRTDFTTADTNTNSITITLADGRTMQLNHTGIVYDEENEIYRTEINELDFMVYEYHDSNNLLCQVYDCIEPMENLGDFKGRVISTITVNYNPELECGDIRMVFLYEIQGDKVIISYPDGKVLEKTVKYDKENDKYYFE